MSAVHAFQEMRLCTLVYYSFMLHGLCERSTTSIKMSEYPDNLRILYLVECSLVLHTSDINSFKRPSTSTIISLYLSQHTLHSMFTKQTFTHRSFAFILQNASNAVATGEHSRPLFIPLHLYVFVDSDGAIQTSFYLNT